MSHDQLAQLIIPIAAIYAALLVGFVAFIPLLEEYFWFLVRPIRYLRYFSTVFGVYIALNLLPVLGNVSGHFNRGHLVLSVTFGDFSIPLAADLIVGTFVSVCLVNSARTFYELEQVALKYKAWSDYNGV